MHQLCYYQLPLPTSVVDGMDPCYFLQVMFTTLLMLFLVLFCFWPQHMSKFHLADFSLTAPLVLLQL